MKVCTFCGHPTQVATCPLCRFDHGSGFAELPDYLVSPPADIRFVRRPYRNWRERYCAYAPEIVPLVPKTGGLVIDVGCGPNEFGRRLREQFPTLSVIGYDQYPLSADVRRHDFETTPLPHGDGEADVVILSHVGEHIEKVHFVLEEVLRVGKSAVVVLPNALTVFGLSRLFMGQRLGTLYGLPLVPPKDRHRWFFSARDAERLIGSYAQRLRRPYDLVWFAHPRVPAWLARRGPNLLCTELMFLLRLA